MSPIFLLTATDWDHWIPLGIFTSEATALAAWAKITAQGGQLPDGTSVQGYDIELRCGPLDTLWTLAETFRPLPFPKS